MSEFVPNGYFVDKNGKKIAVYDASARNSAKKNAEDIAALSEEIAELKKGDSGSGGSTGGTYEDTEVLEFEGYASATSNWPSGDVVMSNTQTQFSVRRRSTLSGGRMYVDWDTNKINGFGVVAHMFDSAGTLCRVFAAANANGVSPYFNNVIGDMGEDAWMEFTSTKTDFHWGIEGPFSLPIPDGYSVRVILRAEGGSMVFPDGTLNTTSAKTWLTTGVNVTVVVDETVTVSSAIVSRNKDVLPLVKAAARCGFNKDGKYDAAKQLTILATTDLHKDVTRYMSALKYMDEVEQIDFGICLGDMMGSYFSDNDGKWFTDNVNSAIKEFYPLIGNHDAGNTASTTTSATKQQQFDKFFAPVLSKLGLDGLTKTYYSVNTNYGVTLIALDCHDVPDTLSNDTTFAVNRKDIGYSQAQVDWLISTLAAVPADNHVIVAVHNTYDPATMVEGAWTQSGHMNDTYESLNDYPDMIPAIINAWQNGETLSKTYVPAKNAAQPTLTVNADFSTRGAGVFAGYLRGHTHRDYIAKMTSFPTQNIYCFSATCHDNYQNFSSDLPRLNDDKSEDCITVVAVDKVSRKVKLVRIGSNVTFDMVRRDMIAVSY